MNTPNVVIDGKLEWMNIAASCEVAYIVAPERPVSPVFRGNIIMYHQKCIEFVMYKGHCRTL